jgi:hypothetical protein
MGSGFQAGKGWIRQYSYFSIMQWHIGFERDLGYGLILADET